MKVWKISKRSAGVLQNIKPSWIQRLETTDQSGATKHSR